MFDKPEVDSYRQISAPQSLRAKVMAQAEAAQPQQHRTPYRFVSIAAAAACLVLVAVGILLGRPAPDAVITLNGSPLSSEAVYLTPDENAPMLASARTVSPENVVFMVETDGAADISVSAGTFAIYSQPEGEFITSGTDCSAAGTMRVEWNVNLENGESAVITIAGREFTLTQNEDGRSICETTGE